mgnify:CR=1 FL=1
MYKKLIKGDYVDMDITGEGSGGSFTRPSSLTIKNATVKDFKKTNGWGSAIYNDGIYFLQHFWQTKLGH